MAVKPANAERDMHSNRLLLKAGLLLGATALVSACGVNKGLSVERQPVPPHVYDAAVGKYLAATVADKFALAFEGSHVLVDDTIRDTDARVATVGSDCLSGKGYRLTSHDTSTQARFTSDSDSSARPLSFIVRTLQTGDFVLFPDQDTARVLSAASCPTGLVAESALSPYAGEQWSRTVIPWEEVMPQPR